MKKLLFSMIFIATIFSFTLTISASTSKLNAPEISVKIVDNHPAIKLTKYSKSATHFELLVKNPETKKFESHGYILEPGVTANHDGWDFGKMGTAYYKARAVIMEDGVIIKESDFSETVSVKPPLTVPTFSVKSSSDNHPIIKITKFNKATTHFGLYRLNPKTKKYEFLKYIEKTYTDKSWNINDDGSVKYKIQAIVMKDKKIERESELSEAVTIWPPLTVPTFKVTTSNNDNPVITITKHNKSTTHFALYRLNVETNTYVKLGYMVDTTYIDKYWSLKENGKVGYMVKAFVVKDDEIIRESDISGSVVINAVPKIAKSANDKIIKKGDKVQIYDVSLYEVGGTVTKVVEDQVSFTVEYINEGILTKFYGDIAKITDDKESQKTFNLLNYVFSYSIGYNSTVKASILNVVN